MLRPGSVVSLYSFSRGQILSIGELYAAPRRRTVPIEMHSPGIPER